MNKQTKTIVKKTAKIAGVTCLALGSAALIASGAALKAMTEGARYLKDSVKKILREEPEAEDNAAETAAEKAEAAPAAEAVADEADFAETEPQNP